LRSWREDFRQPSDEPDSRGRPCLEVDVPTRNEIFHFLRHVTGPVRGQTAADMLPVLQELFALYGPPLLLKHDNGSAFLAGVTPQALLDALVAQLFSPPGQPQYNGAVERSNGVLKTYTHLHAQAAGHPFRWTSEDIQHAQDLANTVSRPWGAGGPSPAEAWQPRTTITPEERQAFTAALSAHRQQAAQELGLDLSAELSHADRTRLDRLALSATLQDLGYLTTQRVRRPPKKPQRLSRKKLARRVAHHRRQAAAAESAAENSRPSQSPEPPRTESDNSPSPLLAGTPPSDTMLAVMASSGSTAAPPTPRQAVPSARRERTFTSWLRRTLTPLLPFSKTANISR
jgi:hypothetical protein